MKKIAHLLAALVLSVASFFLPITKANVFATEYGSGDYILQVGVDSNSNYVTSMAVNGSTWASDADVFRTSDGQYTIAMTLAPGADYSVDKTLGVRTGGDANDYFNASEPVDAGGGAYTVNITYDYAGHKTTNPTTNRLSLNPYIEDNHGGGGQGQNQGNTHATINVSAGAGTYTINGQSRSYDSDPFTSMEAMAGLFINGTMWDPFTNAIDYDSDDTDSTVNFGFETLWINRYYDNIVINGTSYNVADYLDFDDRTAWLNANHGSQHIGFTIPDVPKADSYNIVVKHGENNGTRYLATFLWTADPAQAGSHDYIGHSRLEFVRAEYEVGDTNYIVTEQEDIENHLVRDGGFYTFRSADGFLQYGVTADVDFDDGSLTLPGGAKVTMRVVPEYGYQVTKVNGGGAFTTTDTGVSEFTVVVHDGEAGYFQAEVTAVDDEVVAGSDKVSGGSIEIANGDIDAGTARLSVDDVELSADKISDFENQVDGSYKISSYLDINLHKVLYRGTADNVWSEQIHHLNNKALITLQLDDGIDGNEIVIVHNIDDGEKFEVIEIESYDAETNTITFWTDSFSNYAIASRTVASPNSGAKAAVGASFVTSTLSTTILIATVFSAGAWMAFRLIKK